MAGKKCNYNPANLLFFLLIIMAFNLSVSWRIGEASQNDIQYKTFTDLDDDIDGMVKITFKKIMNYHHFLFNFDKDGRIVPVEGENGGYIYTGENVKGADGFHFQLCDENKQELTLPPEYTDAEGKPIKIRIPFDDKILKILEDKNKVIQNRLSVGEYVVYFSPELVGFKNNNESNNESKTFILKEERDSDGHRNVKPDERIVKFTITKVGSHYKLENDSYYKGMIENPKAEGPMPKAVFNNFYETGTKSITINVQKAIDGREWRPGDQFEFQIEAAEKGTPLRKMVDGKIVNYTDDDKIRYFYLSEGMQKPHNEDSYELVFKLDDLLSSDEHGLQFYKSSKEFTYIIKEIGTYDNIDNAPEQKITIILSNNRSGGALKTERKNGENEKGTEGDQFYLKFENEYIRPQKKCEIQFTKKLEDAEWPSEGFTVELYNVDDPLNKEKVDTKTVKKDKPNGIFTVYVEEGKHQYEIIEKDESEQHPGIFYNTNPHFVEITVSKNNEDKNNEDKNNEDELVATVNYPGQETDHVTIINEKKNLADVTIEAKKKYNYPGKFEFWLTQTDANGTPLDPGIKDNRDNDGENITFKLNLDAGEYYFEMSEKQSSLLQGWKYDDHKYLFKVEVTQIGETVNTKIFKRENNNWVPYTTENLVQFQNTYAVDPPTVEANIMLLKVLSGRDWLETDEFVFRLKNSDGSPIRTSDKDQGEKMVPYLETTARKGNRTPAFPPIIFKLEDLGSAQSKVYRYTVEEISQGNTGFIHDRPKEIKVTLINGDGKLRVTYGEGGSNYSIPGDLRFINRYEIKDEKKAKIGIFKKLENRPWKSGDAFSFQIDALSTTVDDMAPEDIPLPVSRTIQITANSEDVSGQINTKAGYFGEITYTKPGKYWYVIEEIIPEHVEKGMEYDIHGYLVEVNVEDNGDGTLKEPTFWYSSTESERPSVVVNTYNKDKDKDKDSYLFSFAKQWYGVPTDNVSFTLYNPDGTERKHSPVIIKESDKLWIIKYWLSSPGDYYAVENASNGYTPVYQNRGTHEEVQDRVYNGGRIINYQAPPTGDKNHLNALFIIAGICLTGILIYAGRKQNEK